MSHPTPSFYRPDIDGLRGLAVLMVVLFHAGFGFKGGYVGVDLFFVISGYLITGLLFKELDRGTINLASFWERRLRRIAPALAVMLLVTLAAGYVLLFPEDYVSLGRSTIAQALLSANLYFWQDSGYFAAASEEKPLLHLWSLAVEEQFYVLVPVLLLLAHAWLKKRYPAARVRTLLVQGLAVLLGLSLASSIIGLQMDANATFYWLPTRAWELLVGSVLAGLPTNWHPRTQRQREVVGGIALLMIFGSALGYESDTPFPGVAALLPCLGAAGIIWAHLHLEPAVVAGRPSSLPLTWHLMTWRPLVGVGLISYSLYLWHWPLLAFAQYLNVSGHDRPPTGLRVGLVLLAFLFGWLSWRWVETPFRQKAFMKTRRNVFAMGITTTLLFIGLGWQMVRLQGLPGRMPEAALNYAAGSEDKAAGDDWTTLEAAQTGDFPVFGFPKGRPTVMLWGDSHARSLMPMLDSLAVDQKVQGLSAIYSATAPMLGFHRRSRHGLNERSEILAQAVLKKVREEHIPHTVLAAYWRECPGKEPERFASSLVETVRALQATGTQVWVVLDVPTQPFDVPKALALGQLSGGLFSQATEHSVTVEEHRQANAVMQALVPRLIEAGARVVDPMDLLSSPQGRTMVEAQGRSFYSDAHHLSITGAMHLRPLFIPLFDGYP